MLIVVDLNCLHRTIRTIAHRSIEEKDAILHRSSVEKYVWLINSCNKEMLKLENVKKIIDFLVSIINHPFPSQKYSNKVSSGANKRSVAKMKNKTTKKRSVAQMKGKTQQPTKSFNIGRKFSIRTTIREKLNKITGLEVKRITRSAHKALLAKSERCPSPALSSSSSCVCLDDLEGKNELHKIFTNIVLNTAICSFGDNFENFISKICHDQ